MLRFNAPLSDYVKQADQLFAGWQSGEEQAVRMFRANHPKFLDEKIPWLERRITDAEARAIPITRDDASLAVARAYNFLDWSSLEAYATAVADQHSAVSRFEHAAEAVIDGDAAALARLLRDDPGLVRARSTRVCNFDPPVHRSTLLHYLAANGVEGYRQRSPKNASRSRGCSSTPAPIPTRSRIRTAGGTRPWRCWSRARPRVTPGCRCR